MAILLWDEIAAGLVLSTAPEQVYVICGDGGYLMNNSEIVTAVRSYSLHYIIITIMALQVSVV